MVLVHGIGSGHTVWDQMAPELARGNQLLKLDLPGFGDSEPLPPAQRTLPGLADAIEAEMDAAGWKRAHLVGHSMGGWLALELASRGRAVRTVAIAPVGGATPDEAKRTHRRISGDHRATLVAARLPEGVLRGLLAPGFVRQVALRNQMSRGRDVSPELIAEAIRVMGGARSFDELEQEISGGDGLFERNAARWARISSPTLIIWGTGDRILFATGGPRLREAIPGAELHEMAGVGHAPVLDHPEPLARLVTEFIRAG